MIILLAGIVLSIGSIAPQATVSMPASSPQQQEAAKRPPLSPSEISHLQVKAESGDVSAQLSLGRAYADGNGVAQNDALAFRWYRKAAENGDAEAQYTLGVMYRLGRGIDRNKEESVAWYRKAARLGNSSAMYNLGVAYYNGDGVGIDDTYAYTWFLLAQAMGNKNAEEAVQRSTSEATRYSKLDAPAKVAEMFEKGDEVPRNKAEAVKWYRKAADGGNAAASVKLASMLIDGEGVARDYSEALRRCEDAAKQKYSPAATCVGVIYQRGLGVAPNSAEAAKWFERDAELGNALAMFYLGEAYRNGEGVKSDPVTAYMWIWLASGLSLPEAKQQEASLRGGMKEKDVFKAKQKAAEWNRRHTFRGLIDRSPKPTEPSPKP